MKATKQKKYKKASQALAAARELIRPMKRWTQGDLAVRFVKDEYNEGKLVPKSCSTKSKNAAAFCALGAVQHVNGPAQRSATAYLRAAACRLTGDDPRYSGNHPIFDLNDDEHDAAKSHRRVLRMFDSAIKAAKAAGN